MSVENLLNNLSFYFIYAKYFSINLNMRTRIWDELTQSKHHEYYCVFLLAKQKQLLNYFNMFTLALSSAGVMGWTIWKSFPLMACIIISTVQLLKLLQVHLIPSDKQIEKLDLISDFYFDYYNNIEKLWHDYENERITDEEAQEKYYQIKTSEKEVNKVIKEIIKSVNKKIKEKADVETSGYLVRNFNIQ
ncbi:hypothetical protein ACFS5N_03100 [Mucilaginibacter ximonensis]|uniref:SMODS and SLOG-associating 2TM effector domain-containing protein n=1 Tax=Mucilaginibacter ximonensis TaxID=538021 RepID=A0ABW5Y846_9SPHI